MKIRKNIILILKESFKWRNRDLLEKKNNDPPQLTFKNILKSNIYYIIFAIMKRDANIKKIISDCEYSAQIIKIG